ncbi:triose-phosphate transporter family-domain-containing protein [Mycena belliarum]|uniref:Triose-phosphate transporter family-domain-containing protein n=1 Tax=Mycena belliarum TaxID=1033014 RepID=A0AAD6TYN6_9AGAR|nr:triose-phosphate transporter family-domain-containing protein [Mycena belliae]
MSHNFSLMPDAHQYSPAESIDRSLPHPADDGYEMNPTEQVHLASLAEKKRLWWRNAAVNTIFIASWFFFSTILSLYNKWMFSAKYFGFPYPLFVTTMHFFVQFLLAAFLRYFWPHHFRPDQKPTKADYGTKAVPTAVATALDIGLSNLSLKTITLTFFTMCKSSSLIFVLLFAFLFRLEKFSVRLIAVIFLIFSGVLLMVATETHFVLGGFLLVLTASTLGGFRWALTQILLKNKKMGMDNPAATIYWLAPAMGITLGIISFVLDDWAALFSSSFFVGFKALQTVLFLTMPGIVAFCMVLSEFSIIQRAGVVPMSIAGIAKEVTTISISAAIFGDNLTPLNITGVAITVCGIALFTYHKYKKSLDSAVPLDAHGNPISIDRGATGTVDGSTSSQVELDETTRLTRGSDEFNAGDSDDDDASTVYHSRSLFSADADDDAEELRSIRSSKIRWASGDHGRASHPTPPTSTAARESIEVARVWRDG